MKDSVFESAAEEQVRIPLTCDVCDLQSVEYSFIINVARRSLPSVFLKWNRRIFLLSTVPGIVLKLKKM
ncbi:uncharacterized protein Gasu_26580 [Galdieria sulphuraria]|uniref:Uncharacterized protein n=1 Tax=Galdieria sulphuraria TaxID=130081 RepID=M2X133_GALSU|nr:uncharacterized protein Gasu_26580 [Galdieria sulphuraria]EME30075.1 hypothetical protein Gasu_26580 [Galdieria sulphuraria]|eukprot:XP_005706595.1 hypothetical protein Gasu_26580 [Galdieria sulphuraria]